MKAHHAWRVAVPLLLAVILIAAGCGSQLDRQVKDLTRDYWVAVYEKDEEIMAELMVPDSPQTVADILEVYDLAGPPEIVKTPDWHGFNDVAVVLLTYADALGYTHTAMTAIVRTERARRVYCVGTAITVNENTGDLTCVLRPN